jgi:hypothetical protein
MRAPRLLILGAFLLASACAGTLDRLRSDKPDEQFDGVRRYSEETDPAVRMEAIPELFRLVGHDRPDVRLAAFRALAGQKVAGGRTALDLFPTESAPCLILFNVLMNDAGSFTPEEQRQIVGLVLRETCTDEERTNAWLKTRLAAPAELAFHLRAAPDLASAVRLFDLVDDATFAALPDDDQRYGNVAYVVWLADFFLAGRVGDGLDEYGRALAEVDVAKRDLTAALKARADGAADGAERVKEASRIVNSRMAHLVELEPGVKPKLDPVRAGTQRFLVHAAALRAALTDPALRRQVDERFLAAAKLKASSFVVPWVEELSVELAEGRRPQPTSVGRPGKIRLDEPEPAKKPAAKTPAKGPAAPRR